MSSGKNPNPAAAVPEDSDTDSDWSTSTEDDSDTGSETSASSYTDDDGAASPPLPSMPPPPPPAAPPLPPGQLFQSPAIQAAVHKMLTHLQDWWKDSEHLLQLMADKQLPCDTLTKLSDQIDTMLDKSIEKLIKTAASDPSVFPIQDLVGTSRTIKKYVFLKVGEVCCQKGEQDECAEAAKKALVSLKKVRNAGADAYDEMIAHLLTNSEEGAADDVISTPELDALLTQLGAPHPPSAAARAGGA